MTCHSTENFVIRTQYKELSEINNSIMNDNSALNLYKENPNDQEEWKWDFISDNDSKSTEDIFNKVKQDDIHIIMNNKFFYDETLKWYWFKSLHIPFILISFRNSLTKLKVSIGLIPQSKAGSSLNNEEEGLIGKTLYYFKSIRSFSIRKLKFASTSIRRNNLKFRLKITITSLEYGVIHLISPPIYVKSKKYYKESQEQKLKHVNKCFFEPFGLENLGKNLAKRTGVKNNIENDLNYDSAGLFEYFKSSYIKKKIKHPLFLALRFYKSVKLYYNPDLLEFEQNTEENSNLEQQIIGKFQSYLDAITPQILPKQILNIANECLNMEKAHFILYVEHQKDNFSISFTKTISENLLYLQHKCIQITFHIKSIPKNFLPLDYVKLKEAYIKYYKLYKKKDQDEDQVIPNNYDDQTQVQKIPKNFEIALNSESKLLKKRNYNIVDVDDDTYNTKIESDQKDQENIELTDDIKKRKILTDQTEPKVVLIPTKQEERIEKSKNNLNDFLEKTKYDSLMKKYQESLKENELLKEMLHRLLKTNCLSEGSSTNIQRLIPQLYMFNNNNNNNNNSNNPLSLMLSNQNNQFLINNQNHNYQYPPMMKNTYYPWNACSSLNNYFLK